MRQPFETVDSNQRVLLFRNPKRQFVMVETRSFRWPDRSREHPRAVRTCIGCR